MLHRLHKIFTNTIVNGSWWMKVTFVKSAKEESVVVWRLLLEKFVNTLNNAALFCSVLFATASESGASAYIQRTSETKQLSASETSASELRQSWRNDAAEKNSPSVCTDGCFVNNTMAVSSSRIASAYGKWFTLYVKRLSGWRRR